MKFTKLELNSILAGLRLLQLAHVNRIAHLDDVRDVLCDGTTLMLPNNDIDDLCERINVNDSNDDMFVLAVGDGFNGQSLTGPFPGGGEAHTYADIHHSTEPWVIVKVEPPVAS